MSVVLAVAYLGLVQVLDSREMLPPPPEAMGQGDWESTRSYLFASHVLITTTYVLSRYAMTILPGRAGSGRWSP